MRFAGFLELSLSDYKGHVASVVYTQGCNFNCPYCHNSQLIKQDSMDKGFGKDFILKYLKHNSLVDSIVVTGGEPTLQKKLPEFLYGVKKINKKVKLDTNGSNPIIIEELIKKRLVDYIAMDIKASFGNYKIASGGWKDTELIRQSIELIINSGIKCEFRTTCDKNITDEGDLLKIGEIIKGRAPYYLQPCIIDDTPVELDWIRTIKNVKQRIDIKYNNCNMRN